MIGAAARRIGLALVALWLAATLTFALSHLAPGGPAVALGGDGGALGYAEEVARAYGLDRPLPAVYLDWLARIAHGDLGISYRAQAPVASLIAERLPVTLALMLPAIALAGVAGIAIGLAAAASGGTRRGVVGALAALHAVPSYVVAHLLVLVFALGLGLFPVQGLGDARGGEGGSLAMAHHLALPVLTLALVQLAFMALVVRARVGEELARPYVVTARAKGAGRWRVLVRHALRNAALPVVVLAGWRLGTLIGGAVVIETVFALPGLGRLAVTAAIARDHPVVIGVVLVAAGAMIAVNLVLDLVVRWLDPRLGEGRP